MNSNATVTSGFRPHAVEYGNPAEIVADDTNLAELLEKYAPYIVDEARYVPSTWTGFEEAYQAAEALAAEENVTGAQVDEARNNLLDNFAKLRSIADTQRMEEYFAEVGNFTFMMKLIPTKRGTLTTPLEMN